MLAACIIVVACTLFSFSFVPILTRFLSIGKAARQRFSQSVLSPLEIGKDAREVKNACGGSLSLEPVGICRVNMFLHMRGQHNLNTAFNIASLPLICPRTYVSKVLCMITNMYIYGS